MLRRFLYVLIPGLVVWAVFASHASWAFPEMARQTSAACASCHANPAGGAELTDAGKVYLAQKKAPADSAAGAEYRGAHKCRMCHGKEYKSWATTVHASSLTNLAKADNAAVQAMSKKLGIKVHGNPAELADCAKCHVTGLGLPGGYPGADSTAHANLGAVGCEACHGPGSRHTSAKEGEHPTTINRAVSAKLCTSCHTPLTSPKFKFDEYKKTGVHVLPPPGSESEG